MTWPDYALARQLLSEEGVFARLREAKREEEAEFRESSKHLRSR